MFGHGTTQLTIYFCEEQEKRSSGRVEEHKENCCGMTLKSHIKCRAGFVNNLHLKNLNGLLYGM